MRLKSFNLLNAAMQRQFLAKQTEEYRAKLDRAMISKLEADQPLIRERGSS